LEQITTYEKLIAQKLEQAPLPDLADSIWSSIELELDSPAPGDGGQEPPAQNPPGKGLPGAGKLIYAVIPALLITAAWLYFKNKEQHQPQQNAPVIQAPADTLMADSTPVFIQPDQQSVSTGNAKKQTGNPRDTGAFSLQGLFSDSLFQPVIPPATQDSISMPPVNTTPVIKDTASKTAPPKKLRGVKGITDDDYKIIAEKKDSVKKDR
jgi:hypothetical protein